MRSSKIPGLWIRLEKSLWLQFSKKIIRTLSTLIWFQPFKTWVLTLNNFLLYTLLFTISWHTCCVQNLIFEKKKQAQTKKQKQKQNTGHDNFKKDYYMGSRYDKTCTYQSIVMVTGLTGVQFCNYTSHWDLLIKSMIKDRIGQYEGLFPINHKWHFPRILERIKSWWKVYLVTGAYDFV